MNKCNEIKVNDNHKSLYKANNGFKNILNVIDTFSKYVYSIPLKTKAGLEVSEAFSQIFKYSTPKKLHVDKGKEFYNKYLKQILNKYNITMYSTYNNTYHRTIKMKPVEVNKNNENDLLNNVYNYDITNSEPKFEIVKLKCN